MRKHAFWVSELVRCTVTDDGYKGLIFLILIEVGLYYLYIYTHVEADQVYDYKNKGADQLRGNRAANQRLSSLHR